MTFNSNNCLLAIFKKKLLLSWSHPASVPIWWQCPCPLHFPLPDKPPLSRSSIPPKDRDLRGGRTSLVMHPWRTNVLSAVPATEVCGLLPVLMSMKVPVPMVILTSPMLKQHSPNMAACWSAIYDKYRDNNSLQFISTIVPYKSDDLTKMVIQFKAINLPARSLPLIY